MLVGIYLNEAYENFMKKADSEMMSVLQSQVESLRKWGERHGTEVEDPGRQKHTVVRVFEYKGKPMECPIERMAWPLQHANKGLLPQVDDAIVGAFKALKKGGWARLSIVAYGEYLRHIHSAEFDAKWVKSLSGWRGAYLVCLRLESTARVAARYEFGEKFGPKTMYDSNWEATGWQYDNKPWRLEMIKRGLLPRSKRGGQ